MNEVILKQSILKKNRDTINTTPNSVKSVRFNGVEFMVITNDDIDADDLDSDKSSVFEQHELYNNNGENSFLPSGRLKSNISEQTHSTLAPNKKVNLFRLNSKKNNTYDNKTRLSNHTVTATTASTKNLVFQTSAPTVLKESLSNSLQDLTSKSLHSSNRRSKWSQSFNRLLPTQNQKPPITTQRRLHPQNYSSFSRVISGSSSSSASSIQGNHYQQNRITSATNKTASIETVNPQSAPNLALYSYLLQTNSKDKEILNPSVMRTQMKSLSSKTLTFKPFVPKIQRFTPSTASNNFFSSSFKTSNSTSSLQNIYKKKSVPVTPSKGGIIHVNTRNINFLTRSQSRIGDNEDAKSNFLSKTNANDHIILNLGPKPNSKSSSINNVV
jgi:hypothetical protein